MANAINWESSPAITAYLSNDLNALANAAKKIGAAINNSADLDMYMDVELYVAVQGGARSAGAYVAIYLITSVDGTNYGYGDDSTVPPASSLACALPLDAATTARYVTSRPFLVPPGKFKLLVENMTGQAFKADNTTTLGYRLYSEEIQ